MISSHHVELLARLRYFNIYILVWYWHFVVVPLCTHANRVALTLAFAIERIARFHILLFKVTLDQGRQSF